MERGRWLDPLGATLVVAGLVGVGVGAGFTVIARGTENDARAAEFRDDFESGLDTATSQRRIGGVALIGGATLATAGVLRLVLRDRAPRRVAFGSSGTSLFVAGWWR